MNRAALPPWLLPAVVAAVVTLAVVTVVDTVGDDGARQPEALARQRIASIATQSAAATTQPPGAITGAPPSVPSRFTLEPDGLGAVRFGQPVDGVMSALTEQFGTPDEDRNQPCGQGKRARWVRWADLSAVFSATFIGFIDGVHYPPGRPALHLATAVGLAPGDGIERLHMLYGPVPTRAQPAHPGRPAMQLFTISGPRAGDKLSGVLEDEGGETIVSTIFAGALC
jgi:hypothetical protein